MVLKQRASRWMAAAAVAAMFVSASARAAVKLPAVFSDNMVLQQEIPLPVWGTADAGQEVTVTFGGETASAKADANGKFEVKLPPLKANSTPGDLTVSAGSDKVSLKNILIGEVWICSGQSNMEFRVSAARNAQKDIEAANFPEIRLFTVPKDVETHPIPDIKSGSQTAKWEACTPQTVPGFSAVGFFFGRDLYKNLKVPVGLIHTSWGGTPAEAWTAHQYLETDSDLRPILERWEATEKAYPAHEEEWKKTEEQKMKEWQAAVAKAKAANKRPPNRPAGPSDPAHNPNGPSQLYNGMIAPIVPFACRGAIWYQGESNAGRAYQYRKLLPTMIKSWRDAWQEPAMDFYIVSLANFTAPPKEPGDSDWAELREAQAMTAAMPHNGEALAIDLADEENPGDIHPKNKQDVGYRLALVARAKTYGEHVEYSGPEYKSFKVEGDKIVVSFDHHGEPEVRGGGEVRGFQIAGEDHKWHWATAKIEGHDVIVSSPEVPKPLAVRYDWANNPQGNLYNNAGLPAVPFRTDDWKGVTEGKN